MKQRYLSIIRVIPQRPDAFRATLLAGSMRLACRIGKSGVTRHKREGDGRTPRATLRLLRGWWRADRRGPPRTGVRMAPLRADLGWCDAPGHGQYNRLVRCPFRASHEEMRRSDRQYDVVFELDWNVRPRVQGRGSAIFLHVTAEAGTGTAGCIALPPDRIDRVLARIGPRTRLIVG